MVPPVKVPGISNALNVSVGMDFACALLKSQKVTCWGDGQYGQLGIGMPSNSLQCSSQLGQSSTSQIDFCNPIPTIVPGLKNVKSIYTSLYTVCAELTDSSLRCWGGDNYNAADTMHFSKCSNSYFEKNGVQTFTPRQVLCVPMPEKTYITKKFISFSMSDGGNCYISDTGAVTCWGVLKGFLVGTKDSDLPNTITGQDGLAKKCAIVPYTSKTLKVDIFGK
jgi:hypothetical protein